MLPESMPARVCSQHATSALALSGCGLPFPSLLCLLIVLQVAGVVGLGALNVVGVLVLSAFLADPQVGVFRFARFCQMAVMGSWHALSVSQSHQWLR